MRKRDLKGMKFGNLTVIREVVSKVSEATWECVCDCGSNKVVFRRTSKLTSGKILGCGCKVGKTTTHNMSKTRPQKIWIKMRERCNNPKEINYERYGARGITVCEKWLKFEGFWEDMKEGYSDELSLDRIDGAKGYFKENCKWSTLIEQANNTRRNRRIEFNGEIKNLGQWANLYGIDSKLLQWRLNKGWVVERALTQIVRKNGLR